MTHGPESYDLVVDHFAGLTSAATERELRRELVSSPEMRALFGLLLATEDQQADAEEARRERIGRALFGAPQTQQRPVRRRTIAWAVAAVLCLAGLSALLLSSQTSPPLARQGTDPPRAKPALAASASPDRYVSIVVYRRDPASGRYLEARGTVRRGDALAFAYSNGGMQPFDYLLIFGLDEQAQVHWYYPAFTDPARAPSSIAIRPGSDIELPEQVSHRYAGRWLRIFAVFSRAPISVQRVEALAAGLAQEHHDGKKLERFPLPDTGQHSITLEVLP